MALLPRGVAAVAVALSLGAAASAQAAPLIDSTLLKGDAVAGRQVELQIRAFDRQAPVTGMVVGFGAGEGGYGTSTCLPPDSRGRPFGSVVAPGRRVTLAAPHVYATPGRRALLATVISGGCFPGQSATVQGALVNVVPQGSPPQPLVTTPPVALSVGQALPEVPGLGQLPTGSVNVPSLPGPGTPSLPSLPAPSLPPLPSVPALPAVPPPPPLPALPALPALPGPKATRSARVTRAAWATSAARCRNSYRWFSRTRTAERKHKAALLCLLNAERRRRGLRALRANARLARAARAHSRTMVRQRFFAHVGPGRSSPTARLYAARYLPGRGGWAIGENLGFGTGSMTRPISIHKAWMNSTLHRAAMLSKRFREVGFGLYPGIPFQSRGATFTANFATRR